jgi:hypothetical protein
VKDATVQLSKPEANLILEALELYTSIQDAFPGRRGERGLTIIDKIIESGLDAGWEEGSTASPGTSVNIVTNSTNNEPGPVNS